MPGGAPLGLLMRRFDSPDQSQIRNLRRRGVWILVLGFAATAIPLAILAAVQLSYANVVKRTADRLMEERAETIGILERVRRGQTTVRRVVVKLSAGAAAPDETEVIGLIEEYRNEIARASDAAKGSPLQTAWERLRAASDRFTASALGLLGGSDAAPRDTDAFFQLQDDSIVAMRRLVDASHNEIRREVDAVARQSERLRALALYGSVLCLAIAGGAAIVTIRTIAGVMRQVETRSDELRRISGALIEQQETAARRFSHELHDELGQTLSALKAEIGALGAGSERGVRDQAAALALADDAIQSVRDLSHLLHPTLLEHLGLAGALESLVRTFGQRTETEVAFRSDLNRPLSDDSKAHLFRIAQEALTNVARHSGATRVSVTLFEAESCAILEIADNGKGVSDVSNSDGIGLKGMEARASFAGGTLRLSRPPSGGLSVQARVPIDRGKSGDSTDQDITGG